MENYISQLDLELLYNRELKKRGKQGIEEIISKLDSKDDKAKKSKTVFLSHSHLDKTIITKVALLFNLYGVEVYIDWDDATLPEYTDRVTASTIKSKIENSHLFLFLATFRGLQSKWCNWELGIAYAKKDLNNLAILPIETKTGKWVGNEYLQLYPEMKMNLKLSDSEKLDINQLQIHRADGKIISFEEWLKQK